jgi:carboxypeptidase C (cathepsin A)
MPLPQTPDDAQGAPTVSTRSRRRLIRWLVASALAAVLALSSPRPGVEQLASAADAPAPAGAPAAPHLAVTTHSITVSDTVVRYTATAGEEPLTDRAGKPEAGVFFVAYVRQDVADPSRRPITFAFNGGPGAASVLLHLGALGPKRVPLLDHGVPPTPSTRWSDNPYTWLTFTDLVFVDAVGTGYSRAAAGVPDSTFFQPDGDARSFAQFIQRYVAATHRQASPVFLAGESYGGTRAIILARLLHDVGIDVSGLILISPVVDFETLNSQYRNPGRGMDLAYALDVPTYAATAWYHKKLGPEFPDLTAAVHAAERWAVTEYLPALVQGDALPAPAQERIAQALSQYTGIGEAVLRAQHLRLLPNAFRRELLSDQHLQISALDGRIAVDPHAAHAASTTGLMAPLAVIFERYANAELGYARPDRYRALSERVERDWTWGVRGPADVLDVTGDLRDAMQKNPAMKVLVARGYFDLTVPYYGTEYALSRLELAPALANNVIRRYYEGGHMLYTSQASLEKFTDDAAALIASATAPAHHP